MKRRSDETLTKFHKWLIDNRHSNKSFAALMAEQLCVDSFSGRTVEKWRYGAVPRPKYMAAIKAITGLTADDFQPEPEGAT